ncbi:hypothetical protein FHR83_001755 [Actinoplanes campanulatus]|uniref:Uncharacterized protein n=1 Tax=Actinoplanes campanulatus TaxID=113559 RepID=A0A7W5FDB0_9ACTN|nr:hypothetical protein [Actinoplanes campanulatus]
MSPNGPLASRLVHTHCARKAARRNERARHPAAEAHGTSGFA